MGVLDRVSRDVIEVGDVMFLSRNMYFPNNTQMPENTGMVIEKILKKDLFVARLIFLSKGKITLFDEAFEIERSDLKFTLPMGYGLKMLPYLEWRMERKYQT